MRKPNSSCQLTSRRSAIIVIIAREEKVHFLWTRILRMQYRGFISEIERGKIAPAYLFQGKEDYLKKEALKRLKEKIVLPEYEDFNYERFSGANSSVGEIMESVSTLPFKGKWRLVVMEGIDEMPEKGKKMIIEYLDNPVKTTCLVCVAGGEIDKRRKLYRVFLEKGKVVSFYTLYDREIADWIKKRLQRERKKISFEALFYLKERVGNDRRDLNNKIEELIVYTHPRQVIKKEDVEEVLGEEEEEGVFDLTKAIREKDSARAISILVKLLERGENPLRIHSLITREMRILLRVKEKEGKIPSQEVCSIIFGARKSYYPSFYTRIASEYIKAVKKLDFSGLITAYGYLVEAEASIKTGREEPDLAIQRMVLHILQTT